jgi:hypothetical protein
MFWVSYTDAKNRTFGDGFWDGAMFRLGSTLTYKKRRMVGGGDSDDGDGDNVRFGSRCSFCGWSTVFSPICGMRVVLTATMYLLLVLDVVVVSVPMAFPMWWLYLLSLFLLLADG